MDLVEKEKESKERVRLDVGVSPTGRCDRPIAISYAMKVGDF